MLILLPFTPYKLGITRQPYYIVSFPSCIASFFVPLKHFKSTIQLFPQTYFHLPYILSQVYIFILFTPSSIYTPYCVFIAYLYVITPVLLSYCTWKLPQFTNTLQEHYSVISLNTLILHTFIILYLYFILHHPVFALHFVLFL